MLDRVRARRLAEAALRASRADETEVVVEQCEQELNRFTAEHPVQNLVRRLSRVSVRVRVDGREGKAATGTATEEAVRRAVERAAAVARHAPKPPSALLPLAGPQEYRLRDPEPVAPDPRATSRSVAAMTGRARAEGCRAAGIQSAENELRLVLNSTGLDVADLDVRTEVSLTMFKDDGAGWATAIASRREGIDEEALAARALRKTLDSRDPVDIPPGHYTVVLEPSAVASLLLFASYAAFGAQQVEEGSSFLAGKLGTRVAGENVTVTDDCHHPLAIGHTFDGEGMPRSTLPLLARGVASNVVHDRATAQRFGCRSTGHATPQPSSSGPLPSNLVLAAGEGSTEALLRGVDRGILVTQFHYTNMVEPTKLTLTGMTRNGTFLIERGEVSRPVRNLRFTQSLVEALTRVTALGGDATLCSALFGGYTVVPSVRIDGFHFSSGTEF